MKKKMKRKTTSQRHPNQVDSGVLVTDAGARHHVCHPFSCGALSNVSRPFRQQGDSQHCGHYELICTATNAIIRIGGGTFIVINIDYIGGFFWVVDINLGMQSSCPLPGWDNHALEFDPYYPYRPAWATFVNCSQEVNDHRYSPVRCLSSIDSFIYVSTGYDSCHAQNFKPSCHYLAMTPLGDASLTVPEGASYEDVVKFMRKGFSLPFSWFDYGVSRELSEKRGYSVRECMAESLRVFREEPWNSTGISYKIVDIVATEFEIWSCIAIELRSSNVVASTLSAISLPIPYAMWLLKSIHVLCRFVFVPLAIFTFLGHKYWKTRITIDAGEKFLRMQQMLSCPLRYAYTEITAITSHFREKLGHGGYGSVYKGVLHPGNIQVAIKMLSNSKCNGEEFISEVSTIGRIHHVNVVRLLGFCSEEMRRALVYEYMPNSCHNICNIRLYTST